MSASVSSSLRRAAALLYIVAILATTVGSIQDFGTGGMDFSLCLWCGSTAAADAVLNVLLFVPLGVLLVPDLGVVRTLWVGGLLSLSVETGQLWIPGRYTAASDLLFNTLGTGIGTLLLRVPPLRSSSRGHMDRILAAGWVAGVLCFLVTSGILLRPSVTDERLYGQLAPDPGLGGYLGLGLQGSVGGMRLISREWADDHERLRSLLEEEAPVTVRFVAGPPPSDRAPIFNVFDENRDVILSLAAEGEDLLYYRRYVADDLRFERPRFRVPGALARFSRGDTISIHVERTRPAGYRIEISGESPGTGSARTSRTMPGVEGRATRSHHVYHIIGESWALILGGLEPPVAAREIADLLWLGLLGLPLGLWAPSFRFLVVPLSLISLALYVLPFLSPLAATPVTQYMALFAGTFLGRGFRFAATTRVTARS